MFTRAGFPREAGGVSCQWQTHGCVCQWPAMEGGSVSSFEFKKERLVYFFQQLSYLIVVKKYIDWWKHTGFLRETPRTEA